jgi:Uma2 family endonuclease
MSPAAAIPETYRVTFEDWLRFPDDGRLYEILDGELYVSPTPNTRHQRIASDLHFWLYRHLREGGLGTVLPAPTGVRLAEDSVPEPDLVVILAAHSFRIEEAAVVGPPDLVVEILSPGTAGRDLGPKRALYERSGVPEYWIVDPQQASVEVLSLEGGAYVRAGLNRRADRLVSRLLVGLEIPLEQVFM